MSVGPDGLDGLDNVDTTTNSGSLDDIRLTHG
jgi:hypothetical protein